MPSYSESFNFVDSMLLQKSATDPTVHKSIYDWLCELLKKKFENTLQFTWRISIKHREVHEIPFSDEFIKNLGLPEELDIPQVYVDSEEKSELIVSPKPILNDD
jgi:disulfide oxidoreductase YuzD